MSPSTHPIPSPSRLKLNFFILMCDDVHSPAPSSLSEPSRISYVLITGGKTAASNTAELYVPSLDCQDRGHLDGDNAICHAKCLAKVVQTMKTVVLNIQTPVRIIPLKLQTLILSWIKSNQEENTSPWAWHCWTPSLVLYVYKTQSCLPAAFPIGGLRFHRHNTQIRSQIFKDRWDLSILYLCM